MRRTRGTPVRQGCMAKGGSLLVLVKSPESLLAQIEILKCPSGACKIGLGKILLKVIRDTDGIQPTQWFLE